MSELATIPHSPSALKGVSVMRPAETHPRMKIPPHWLLLILAVLVALVFYLWVKQKHSYFREMGLPYVEPIFFLGNIPWAMIGRESLGTAYTRIYQLGEPHPIVGAFQMLMPHWVVRDPELANEVLIKKFSSFEDHVVPSDEEYNPLEGHLFNLKGDRWRTLRNKLLPAFTSGKLKMLFPTIEVCADGLMSALEEETTEMGEVHLDANDLMARYTTDNIGSCIFGFEPEAMKDPECRFHKMGRRVFQQSPRQLATLVIRSLFPSFTSYFHLKTYPADMEEFFFGIFREAFAHRLKTGVARRDFVQILLELKEKGVLTYDLKDKDEVELVAGTSEKLEITDNMLAAQAYLFFSAGFETSATTLGYTLYHLSKHPDCQQKVRQEIAAVKTRHGGCITFDAVKDMMYLEACVLETLRLVPPSEVLFRKCTKACTLGGGTYPVYKGMTIMIPVRAIQHDPNNYSEPLTFVPERFQKGDNFAGKFLPFGDGPRICIGKKLALLQIKLGLAKLLDKYSVDKSHKLEEPIKTSRYSFIVQPVGGIWLKFEKLVV